MKITFSEAPYKDQYIVVDEPYSVNYIRKDKEIPYRITKKEYGIYKVIQTAYTGGGMMGLERIPNGLKVYISNGERDFSFFMTHGYCSYIPEVKVVDIKMKKVTYEEIDYER